MSRLNGEKIYELLDGIGEDLIIEATPAVLLAGTAAAAGTAVNTAELYTIPGGASGGTAVKAGFGAWLAKGGWVALAAGAVAAAGIAVGAFFFGSSGDLPSAGSDTATIEQQESLPSEDLTEKPDYAGETQEEVSIRHGDRVINPQKFFLYDGVADGLGFEQEVKLYHNNQPELPKVYYAKDGSISPCELILTEGYEFSHVRVYNESMQESAVTYDGSFNYRGFLSVLPTGTYYVALQIKHGSGGHEYAYKLVVVDTQEEIEESESESESETDTPAEPEVLRYFQFPLRGSNDTTSYVSIPDMVNEPSGPIEFFVLPSDTDTPELTEAYKLYISKSFPMNIQLIAFKSETSYGILYVMDKAQPFPQGNNSENRVIGLECYSIYFDGTESGGYYSIYADSDSEKGCHYFESAEGKKVSVAQYKVNQGYVRRAEDFIDDYSDLSKYEYTVLYSYIDGVETINQPVESLPVFPFSIFNAYNEPDLG